ncbi:hypothetical protein LSAT2_002470 [Lamellibrachia satsuma]|nr:hypothetical protein LSAT2_002470 [Lamellibrachia satsuma]
MRSQQDASDSHLRAGVLGVRKKAFNQSINMKSSIIVILFAAAMLVISCDGNESAQFHLYRLCLLGCWKKFNKCTTGCQGGGKGDAGFERCERKFTKCEAKCQKNSL